MRNCIICKKKLKRIAVSFDNMPRAAQHMPERAQIDCEKGMTLDLYECTGCGLVQFDCEPVEYYRDVIRATGVSPKFRELRVGQYRNFIDTFELTGKKIVEIGCGAGEFLKILEEFPVEAYGIEHNEELIRQAQKSGHKVQRGFVENEDTKIDNAPFDAFVSFNFLEHQPHPRQMLSGIFENLADEGVGMLTVPSFEYFQEEAAYYEFLRDHIAYYTEETLKLLLQLTGFEVVQIRRFNKDTIEVLIKKRVRNKLPDFSLEKEVLESKLNQYIQEIAEMDGEIIVWGASHQAFTLLSTMRFKHEIAAIVDSASFKWNKYSPASHLPIISPEEMSRRKVKGIIIMAPGYSDEIFSTIQRIAPETTIVLSVNGNSILKLK